MIFAYPYVLLLLLALPLLAWLKGQRGQRAAFLYSSVGLVKGVANLTKSRSGAILAALRWLALALLIVAIARPQMGEGLSKLTASGIDIAISLDLSDSMSAEDFKRNGEPIDRLAIAKEVLQKFIVQRPADRIGLVAFSGKAYIAAPQTLDHDFLLRNLERLTIDTVPEEGTAIGEGIATAVNRLRDIPSKSKIVILMTDGQNNMGKIPPLTAADIAQALGIKVYTIGVGTHGIAQLPRRDAFGRKYYVPINVDIDENVLQEIAHRTGGKYYRADKTETLHAIYSEIDRMEKTISEFKKYQRYREVFHWFAGPGLALILVELMLGNTVWRKLP